MTFLPMVDRELREGSRRRATYWLRVRVAFQALLIGVGGYIFSLLQPSFRLGTVLFWGLSGAALLFCLLAGRRSTADCLSQEKREGTLGLLFLTDLKGYDVVLGKMAGNSIAGLYALLAVFPVLAIPLLAGGMSKGELWRMALVLLNTFFLSLAIGVFGSAISREYRTAIAMNFVLSLLLVAAPAACGLGIGGGSAHRFEPWLFYSCPVFSFISCGDGRYRDFASDFWWSLAVTHALAWMLTLLACWIVPRTWGDKPPPALSRRWRWRDMARRMSLGSLSKGAAFRRKALDTNAYFWLAARARLKPAQVWFFLGMVVGWWVYERLRHGAYTMTADICIAAALVVNSAFKLWLITEAGQRLGEDRRSGAFELLLATPLTVRDFLGGQMLALRRQFFAPLVVLTALELGLVLALHRLPWFGGQEMLMCLAAIGLLWADMLTLAWVAMAAALLCKSQTQAAAFTVARILLLPWGAFAFVMSAIGMLQLSDLIRWRPGDSFALALWFGLGVAADLFFGLRAWYVLRRDFRQLALQSFLTEPSGSNWRHFLGSIAKWIGRCVATAVPRRARKPVLACLTIGLALAAVFLARTRQAHFPPPVLISITQSNGPFRVFPGGKSGVFFIMPDGTLWQWGRPGAPSSPRSVVPEQVGHAHDWVKVVGAGTHCLGLRSDGTIWGWGFSNGGFWPEPQPAMEGHDWIDLGTGQHHAAAIKRDGTLWIWNEPLVAHDRRRTPHRRFVSSNNVAVYCGLDSTLALKGDGTIWVEGRPILLCAETNWTSLDANGLARNQAGEWWDVANAIPNPQAGASAVCSRLGSDWALEGIDSTPSLRPNWVTLWRHDSTGFGLTADGTVWTWGLELDKDPVKNYESRLELLRDRLTGRAAPSRANDSMSSSFSAQPRPLLQMVGRKDNPQRK